MKTHFISKDDLTEYAKDRKGLDLWGALTDDRHEADEIEVQVIAVTKDGKRVPYTAKK